MHSVSTEERTIRARPGSSGHVERRGPGRRPWAGGVRVRLLAAYDALALILAGTLAYLP